MIPSIKYLAGAFLGWPLLPLMYLQGKNIKKSVPALPEARNPQGREEGKSKETIRLITIGESTVAGIGVDQHQEGLTGALARTIAADTGKSVNWRVWARSGYTAKRVNQKLIPKIEQDQVDLIVIGLGSNDAFNLNPPWSWQKDIKDLLVALHHKFPQTPIVFANMPPIKEFPAFTGLIKFFVGNLVEVLGAQLEKTIERRNHTYYSSEVLKLEPWLQKFPGSSAQDFFSDGVHPSALTYQTWGTELAMFILGQQILSR